MKKILILSDTHSYLHPSLITYIEEADEVWHAGDWGNVAVADTIMGIKPIQSVYGNIDGKEIRAMFGLKNVFRCENLTIGMAHIAGKPNYYKAHGLELLKEQRVDIFVCGHSHLLQVQRDKFYNNMLFINPGAAGREGFHKVMTAIRLKIDDKRIYDVAVIELGARGKIDLVKG